MPAIRDLNWPRATERLSLRPVTPDDVEPLWRIRSQEEVNRWMTHAAPELAAFAERAAEPHWLEVTLVVELDGVIIGDVMFAVEDAWSQGEVADQAKGTVAEIGWCLDPAVQGHGYGAEVARELLRIGFEDVGLHRIIALCFSDNEPSWRLMERIGMRREGHHVRESLHRDGGWMDSFTYALLAEEWGPASTVVV